MPDVRQELDFETMVNASQERVARGRAAAKEASIEAQKCEHGRGEQGASGQLPTGFEVLGARRRIFNRPGRVQWLTDLKMVPGSPGVAFLKFIYNHMFVHAHVCTETHSHTASEVRPLDLHRRQDKLSFRVAFVCYTTKNKIPAN